MIRSPSLRRQPKLVDSGDPWAEPCFVINALTSLEEAAVDFGWCKAVRAPVRGVWIISAVWIIKATECEGVDSVSNLARKLLEEDAVVLIKRRKAE